MSFLRIGELIGLLRRPETEYRSEKDLSLWAEVRDWEGEVGVNRKGRLGVQGIVLGGGELGPEYSPEAETTVLTQKGRRIELKG